MDGVAFSLTSHAVVGCVKQASPVMWSVVHVCFSALYVILAGCVSPGSG
jgi:hypothetical protein